MSPKRRVIWAVDVMAGAAAIDRKMTVFLSAWSAATGAAIEPAYVMSPTTLKVPRRYFDEHRDDCERHVRERAVRVLSASGCAPGATCQIIATEAGALRGACSALLAHAQACGAEMIAVATHARHGVPRLVLGSFAETLLHSSTMPLLCLTPHSDAAPIRHILVPTDLGPHATAAVRRIAQVAAAFSAKLTLVNVADFDATFPAATFGPADAYERHRTDDLASRRQLLTELVAAAASAGAPATFELVPGDLNVAAALVDICAKLRPELIAMVSRKTGVESAWLGSVALNVLRHVRVPVWVVHDGG